MKKLIILIIGFLLVLSACGSQNGIPHSQFSKDELMVYNFTKDAYSGDHHKLDMVISRYAKQTFPVLDGQESNGTFSEIFKDIKIIKLVDYNDHGHKVKLILVRLKNNEATHENI
jgi:hypothetical protein